VEVGAAGRGTVPASTPRTAGELPRVVAVYARPVTDDDLWQQAAEGFRVGLPAGVELARRAGDELPAGRPPAGEVWVKIALRDRRTVRSDWAYDQPTSAGRVVATVVGPAATRVVDARYEEKPWANDFDRFVAGAPANRQHFLVARTERPCATRAEAEAQAIATAASELESRFRRDLHTTGISGPVTGVHGRAVDALTSGRYIKDRQVRRFTRPYGEVWDAAILVDASDETLRGLARDAQVHRQVRRAERVGVAFAAASAAVMIGVIGLLYAVVNAFTRGYFAGRLRVLAAVTALGGVLLGLAMLA
jgi:hypothetical protein